MTQTNKEFLLGKERYCPKCYFQDEKVILKEDCPHWQEPRINSIEEKMKEFDEKFWIDLDKSFPCIMFCDRTALPDDVKSFLRQALLQTRKETITDCLNEIIDQRQKFANTPIDQRENGWDWLGKVYQVIKTL